MIELLSPCWQQLSLNLFPIWLLSWHQSEWMSYLNCSLRLITSYKQQHSRRCAELEHATRWDLRCDEIWDVSWLRKLPKLVSVQVLKERWFPAKKAAQSGGQLDANWGPIGVRWHWKIVEPYHAKTCSLVCEKGVWHQPQNHILPY